MSNQQRSISFIQFQLPAIAWCMFIFIASSIPMAKLPSLENYSDKFVHAGVFFILAWLMHVALFHQSFRMLSRYSLMITVLFVMMFGVLDEFHQSFTPGRSVDPFDVVADTFGAVMYAAVNLRFKFYRLGTGE